jgi:uncharacterized membrane protein
MVSPTEGADWVVITSHFNLLEKVVLFFLVTFLRNKITTAQVSSLESPMLQRRPKNSKVYSAAVRIRT